MQALISIRIAHPRARTSRRSAIGHTASPKPSACSSSRGGNDFLLHVAVPNTDALYAFVIDRLTERPEVADVNTTVVYEHLRKFVVEPLARTSPAR